jgi:hypothetical protein
MHANGWREMIIVVEWKEEGETRREKKMCYYDY